MDVVEALTGAIAEAPAGTEAATPVPVTGRESSGGEEQRRPAPRAQSFDFRQPTLMNSVELRKLRLWHEDYARALAARLSMYLRLDAAIQLTRIETVPYHQFIQGLPEATYLTLFKIEPLRGVCVMELPSRLGMIFVDRLLGGPAKANGTPRELSELETALLDEVVQMILVEWTGRWTHRSDLHCGILGHENGGQFVQIASSNTYMLSLAMQVQVGEFTEQIQFGFPCATLEPLVRELGRILDGGTKERTAQPAAAAPKWNPALEEVEVTLAAEWSGMEVSVREWAALRPGDVLQLRSDASANVQIRVGAVPKYAGRLGSIDDHLAIEISKLLKS